MKRVNKEKGSILLMSAILLAVVTLMGTFIITLFFKGFLVVAREIAHERAKLEIQTEAQEYYADLNLLELEEGIYPEGLTYDTLTETYTFSVSDSRFQVNVILDNLLNIKKWQIKEIKVSEDTTSGNINDIWVYNR